MSDIVEGLRARAQEAGYPKPELYESAAGEIEFLRQRERKLRALENGGVENWDGYEWAMEAAWNAE